MRRSRLTLFDVVSNICHEITASCSIARSRMHSCKAAQQTWCRVDIATMRHVLQANIGGSGPQRLLQPLSQLPGPASQR